MSETQFSLAKQFWYDYGYLIIVGVAFVLLVSALWLLAPLSPSPRDQAIQDIAALQRQALSQQLQTNQLLMLATQQQHELQEWLKAQQERGRE